MIIDTYTYMYLHRHMYPAHVQKCRINEMIVFRLHTFSINMKSR